MGQKNLLEKLFDLDDTNGRVHGQILDGERAMRCPCGVLRI